MEKEENFYTLKEKIGIEFRQKLAISSHKKTELFTEKQINIFQYSSAYCVYLRDKFIVPLRSIPLFSCL